jgi:hypothetical protein
MRVSFLMFASLLALGFGRPADLLASGPPTKNPAPLERAALIRQLDADFQNLLANEPHAESVREAARLLAETNQNSRWMNFFQATALLRKHRPRAGVPLLLRYLVEHASFGSSHIIVPQYVVTLKLLTGESAADPLLKAAGQQKEMEKAVGRLYADWWQPNKKTLTTDLGKMPVEKVAVIVRGLLSQAEQEILRNAYSSDNDRLVSTESLYNGLTRGLGQRHGRQEWWKEELHGRMTPILLDLAGYVENPVGNPAAGPTRVSFPAAGLLAVLRQEGQARLLDRIVADEKQNNATRLTCVLALHLAGEDMPLNAVVSILDRDPRLECRVLSLLLLGLSPKNAVTAPRLLVALEDRNREVRLAAMHSLTAFAPREALPRVSRIVRDGTPPELVRPAVDLLGRIGGDEAARVLVEALEKGLRKDSKSYDVYYTLYAFSSATDTRWIEAGAHDPAYYNEKARKAIAWWKMRAKQADGGPKP